MESQQIVNIPPIMFKLMHKQGSIIFACLLLAVRVFYRDNLMLHLWDVNPI